MSSKSANSRGTLAARNLAEAASKTADLINRGFTPDSEIKPDKTDKSGRTANVEKQEQYGKKKYRTWKLTGKNPLFSSFKDPTGDSTLFIFQGDSTLFIPFSGGGRMSTDLNNKE